MNDPTFVAEFANGETTRMTTFTPLHRLDFARGVRITHAAMGVRVSHRPELLEGSETNVKGWFEFDGNKLGELPATKKCDGAEEHAGPDKPAAAMSTTIDE